MTFKTMYFISNIMYFELSLLEEIQQKVIF